MRYVVKIDDLYADGNWEWTPDPAEAFIFKDGEHITATEWASWYAEACGLVYGLLQARPVKLVPRRVRH